MRMNLEERVVEGSDAKVRKVRTKGKNGRSFFDDLKHKALGITVATMMGVSAILLNGSYAPPVQDYNVIQNSAVNYQNCTDFDPATGAILTVPCQEGADDNKDAVTETSTNFARRSSTRDTNDISRFSVGLADEQGEGVFLKFPATERKIEVDHFNGERKEGYLDFLPSLGSIGVIAGSSLSFEVDVKSTRNFTVGVDSPEEYVEEINYIPLEPRPFSDPIIPFSHNNGSYGIEDKYTLVLRADRGVGTSNYSFTGTIEIKFKLPKNSREAERLRFIGFAARDTSKSDNYLEIEIEAHRDDIYIISERRYNAVQDEIDKQNSSLFSETITIYDPSSEIMGDAVTTAVDTVDDLSLSDSVVHTGLDSYKNSPELADAVDRFERVKGIFSSFSRPFAEGYLSRFKPNVPPSDFNSALDTILNYFKN